MNKNYERPVVELESFMTDAIMSSVEFEFNGEMLSEGDEI